MKEKRIVRSPSKMSKVMHEYKHHKLHMGSKHGKIVTKKTQAVFFIIFITNI